MENISVERYAKLSKMIMYNILNVYIEFINMHVYVCLYICVQECIEDRGQWPVSYMNVFHLVFWDNLLFIFELIKLLWLDTKFQRSAYFHLPSADLQTHTVAWLLTWVPGLPSADFQTHTLDTVAWLSTGF